MTDEFIRSLVALPTIPAQNRVGQAGGEKYQAEKNDRCDIFRIRAENGGRKGNKRHEKKKQIIEPEQSASWKIERIEKLVMRNPENGNEKKADDKTEKFRQKMIKRIK